MASGTTVIRRDMQCYFFEKEVTLTVGQNNANQIDFSSEIANNRPGGYVFDHLEYVGAWPMSTWDNAVVGLMRGSDEKKIYVTTMSTQRFTIRAWCWYRRL